MFFDNTTYDLIARGLILTTVALAYVILLTRIVGLRSFSKMTNFDFVMTVASGTVLAGMGRATDWEGFGQAATVMLALFAVQFVIAKVRKRSDTFEQTIQNEPILLMRDGVFFQNALRETRVAESDVIAKLREANVLDLSQVRAVVLETTGDISVMHGEHLQEVMLKNVRSVHGEDANGYKPELQNP